MTSTSLLNPPLLNANLAATWEVYNPRPILVNQGTVRTGVPQRAVISPLHFNFFLKDLPSPPTGIQVIQYADDISIYSSGKTITSISISISSYVNKVTNFLEERELLVSPEQSTVTLFTPNSHEAKIQP